jgi:LysM repeat protein
MGVGNIDFEALVGGSPAAAPAPVKAAPKAPAKPKSPAKPKTSGKTYKVVKGDNLTKIAKAHGTTVAELVKLNGIKDKNLINIGQVLKVG